MQHNSVKKTVVISFKGCRLHLNLESYLPGVKKIMHTKHMNNVKKLCIGIRILACLGYDLRPVSYTWHGSQISNKMDLSQ